MRHILAMGFLTLALAGCAAEPEAALATSPQYAPDDPCKGVVPELCAV